MKILSSFKELEGKTIELVDVLIEHDVLTLYLTVCGCILVEQSYTSDVSGHVVTMTSFLQDKLSIYEEYRSYEKHKSENRLETLGIFTEGEFVELRKQSDISTSRMIEDAKRKAREKEFAEYKRLKKKFEVD